MATQVTRKRALSLYRRLMRSSRTWPGPQIEKDYIKEEAHTLFRRDQHLSNQEEINKRLFDGESRYDIAWHYKIPYPRLHNYPTGSVTTQGARKTLEHVAVPQWEDDEEDIAGLNNRRQSAK